MRRSLIAVMTAIALLVFASGALIQPTSMVTGVAHAQSASACGLAQLAFCDTFDAPSSAGAGTRSGDLDGVLWGVSRATNDDNPSQGQLYRWSSATAAGCSFAQTVAPEKDVAICQGRLVDSVSDADQDTILAMYPRQPFDIDNRTGIATFDVNNDTQGPHAAWPAFVFTDQPVPAPYGQAAGLADNPRNSLGLSIATPNCNGDEAQTGVDQMWTTTNYQLAFHSFTTVGCVRKATSTRQLNHFEIHISQSQVQVWGTDPGSTTLKELAVGNFHLPLTRGLIWIEDVHYNACKFNNQCNHSFVWDNVGFDGPVLPRDLGFDVADAHTNFTGRANLGYLVPAGGSLTVHIPNVSRIPSASAALLELTFWPHGEDSLRYAVNGHPAHEQAWPFGPGGITYSSQTIAMPVPLNELITGTNSVVMTSSDGVNGGVSIANIDLILVGAGGVVPPSSSPPPAVGTSTPTRTPPAIATSTPTRTPAAATPTRTPTPRPTSTPTASGGSPSTPPLLAGDKAVESGLDSNQPGMAEAFQYLARASGTASHILLYVDRTNTARQILVGVYADNPAAGGPGRLLAQASITNPHNGAWNTVAIHSFSVRANTKYWIAILGPATTSPVKFRDVANRSVSVVSAERSLTNLPTTWSTGATGSSSPASMYITP